MRSIEFFGWYGALAILVAYTLVNFSYLEPTSIWYLVLNASGALGIVCVSFYKKAYPPGVLNIFWLVVALIGIFRSL